MREKEGSRGTAHGGVGEGSCSLCLLPYRLLTLLLLHGPSYAISGRYTMLLLHQTHPSPREPIVAFM